ncbi:PREDICTED: uncharacterized protein LOC104777512 isoform X2 [Camelina sativa]|uniref:Uncharacterized protein LOC104777512 isoform X2 n=1 Tax=Camelina sativa TaxID=90675 RepID=A0ABM0YFC2_CAMSA|nr:PREDICTED: uncharacterized protein LOC104777512 isoform X2 [Camelina sativa]
MDKGEQSLAPEWLRSSGHASGGGSSNHLLVSSSSHSDSASLQHNIRNRNSRSKSDVDSIHSPFLDRSSSTNSRRGSSNGSAKHAYSSFNFNRSQRDKDRSREKDRVSYVDPWDLDTAIPIRTILTGRDPDPLRRSHSMVTRKQGDHLSRGLTVGLKNGGSSNSYNGNGIRSGSSIGNSFQRAGFDKDFPSLGAEEKQGGQDVVRVSSPGLSSAVQNLPVGNSALIGGEGWTSALAEVPNVIEKACAGSLTSPKANAVSTGALSGPSGLNMAEALVQVPARTHTPPQGSVKTQILEDLAIKQSRQLIPVVPSAPKCSSSSDKSKTKQVIRAGETCLAPLRNAQQQPSVLLGNLQSNPSGQIKSEKKLLVLKPARENGVSAVKESGSPSANTNSRAASSQLMSNAQPTQSAPVRSTNSPKELKGASAFSMISGQTIEKKSSAAQTQSRSAFYSALKQKTVSTSISTDPVNSSTSISSSVEGKVNSSKDLVASDPSSPQAASGLEVTERVQVASHTSGFEAADTPDEKEAEFLRSLGWDENSGEVALTKEEIEAFVERYNKLRPSLPQRLPMIQEAREDVA